jgi:uncharacterized membrane protein
VENNPNLEMASCPAHTSSTPNLIMITFGISILIFISGVLLLFFKFETNKPDKNTVSKFKNHDLSDLSDDEKKIYEFIKSEGGSIYQSNIINKTGYSKVKITRILDTLEYDHKLIDRKRRGMTNIVILK